MRGMRGGGTGVWLAVHRHDRRRLPADLLRREPELYATGWDPSYGQEVWQRVAGRWIVRPDMAPTQVLPTPPHPPYGIDVAVGDGPWYAISSPPEWPYGGQVIWRRE